jgi:hypothetical protein
MWPKDTLQQVGDQLVIEFDPCHGQVLCFVDWVQKLSGANLASFSVDTGDLICLCLVPNCTIYTALRS